MTSDGGPTSVFIRGNRQTKDFIRDKVELVKLKLSEQGEFFGCHADWRAGDRSRVYTGDKLVH